MSASTTEGMTSPQSVTSGNVTDDEYYYDYDYDMGDYAVPLGELIPVILTYSITLLLGLVGNTLVIFSISYYRRMRTVTNVFLLSLASADLLLVLICVPIKAAAFFSFTWDFGEPLCKLVYYTQNFSMICSVLTLTVISLERLVAVVFPLQAKYLCTMRHAQIVVVSVWVLSALLALPIVIVINHKEVGEKHKAYWCIKDPSDTQKILGYEMYMLTLLFLLPLLIMIVAYTVIAVTVWHVSDMRAAGGRQMSSTPSDARQRVVPKSDSGERVLLGNGTRSKGSRGNKRQVGEEMETRKQVVAMLAMVVLLFAVCWGPILVNNVLTAWGHLHHLHYGFLKPMRMAFFLMSYFNSCVNPIVYAFFSRNFRQSFRIAICACLKGKAFVRAYRYSISAASTRTSAIHFNGRATMSATEKDSSGNDITRSAISAYSPDDVELQKMTM